MIEQVLDLGLPGCVVSDAFVPQLARDLMAEDDQKAIPAIAKDARLIGEIECLLPQMATEHRVVLGDSRRMPFLGAETVHLVVTSPPYWTLKEYPERDGQLGMVEDYEGFLNELEKVWREAYRVLVPGGRMVIVVGDVNVPRKTFGRHLVFPLHAAIQEQCRRIGFDNLAPIIWYKIANAKFEAAGNSGRFLGKPYEPNAVIKNDIEFILFQRKPGGYRSPSAAARVLSVIPEALHREWFQQIWTLHGASTAKHPAPYPLTLAERLVRMYSFVGDTVLDPFMGTGTTNLAASKWGRSSVGIDIEPAYFDMAKRRMEVLRAQKQLPLHELRVGGSAS